LLKLLKIKNIFVESHVPCNNNPPERKDLNLIYIKSYIFN